MIFVVKGACVGKALEKRMSCQKAAEFIQFHKTKSMMAVESAGTAHQNEPMTPDGPMACRELT